MGETSKEDNKSNQCFVADVRSLNGFEERQVHTGEIFSWILATKIFSATSDFDNDSRELQNNEERVATYQQVGKRRQVNI